LLKKRYGDDVNEFFIAGEDRYPLLSILVRGSVACLHFFPQAAHPGSHSRLLVWVLDQGKVVPRGAGSSRTDAFGHVDIRLAEPICIGHDTRHDEPALQRRIVTGTSGSLRERHSMVREIERHRVAAQEL
jgi:hypothetical protein